MKDLKKLKKKLEKVAKSVNPTNDEMGKLKELASKYKGKSQEDIEREMKSLMNKFSAAEKNDLIKKMKMLKRMGLLDKEQEKKLDEFIKMMKK